MSAWWVDRWQALLGGLGLGPNELRAGGTAIRKLSPDRYELLPGQISVRFPGREEQVATITVDPLGEEQRHRAVELAVAQPNLVAGVLLGELPAALDAPWREAGVSLIPSATEVTASCSCEHWTGSCRHVAGVAKLISTMIATEPHVLLMLRSWAREEFVDAIRHARAADYRIPAEHSDQPRGDDPGMDPIVAYRRKPAPLPSLRPVPRRPGTAKTFTTPPADSGVDRAELAALVNDAAQRAAAVLGASESAGLHLDAGADLVRRGAAVLDDREALRSLAQQLGADPDQFEARARAWAAGGPSGLVANDHRWTASSEQLQPGLAAFGGKGRAWANVVQHRDRQLRLDPDGRWWAFRADPDLGWVLESGGLSDPHEL